MVIEDFAEFNPTTQVVDPSFGIFRSGVGPAGSGSNGGAVSGTTAISSTPWDFTPGGGTSYVNNLSITDDNLFGGGLNYGVPTAWTLRHIANGGAPSAANLVSAAGGVGSVGFYLQTTSPDLSVRIALDETGGSGGTEGSVAQDVIADGEYHLYQWSLADAAQWNPLFGASNGELDGTTYTIDSIVFYDLGAEDGSTSDFNLAYVVADNTGPLVNVVPEPVGLLALGLAGFGLLGRRRAG
ncbi:hypothetical protein PSMK_12860 [Phycisphaera mikurensis NBRC 102666]|uniref:PEP-CTERM protein-sorting domain-containing protein n=1 Tax=Phycisphaera mikurensis (strain NBRC 102666 / KCTC 22515 / FYK2301M01) TaxID=1142394 RepID=I0IDV7_PHYMF|nr:hypothetical protein PSMK_12860 [Phycisphaera mikurensis NBRC 102666]